MRLEQIFYGRGENGYGILGSSIPSSGLTDGVVRLCQSVGTPGLTVTGNDRPFLLQRVVGSSVVMVCGRTGTRDSLGRGTLFFHALVASVDEARRLGVSAVDLHERGFFASSCAVGKVDALDFEGDASSTRMGRNGSVVRSPAVVRCRRGENLDVARMLGMGDVGTNWATFSWEVLVGMDVYGLDESIGLSSVPASVNVYDVLGRLIRSAESSANVKASGRDEMRNDEKEGRREGPSVKLVAFVGFVGLLLGAGIGFCYAPVQGQRSPTVPPSVETCSENVAFQEALDRKDRRIHELEARLADQRQAEQARSRPAFDELQRIHGRDELKRKIANFEIALADPKNFPEAELYRRLVFYVDFVNRFFPEKGQEDVK